MLQMEQLPDVLQFFAMCLPVVAEQVIDVPKIILENIPVRTLCREPQLVEQLVEMPTILTHSFIRMLQNVDIPVPHGGRGASRGLQGFLPGHSSSVPVEQNDDIPGPVQRLQDLRPRQSSASSSHSPDGFPDDAFGGFFRTFPQVKKNATLLPHSGSELPPHSSRWTPAAHDVPMALEEEEEESEDEPDFDVEYVEFDGRWWGPSGSQLASGIAGGWPLPMGPRLAILSGGLRGSSAAGQGHDAVVELLCWCLVRQWIHVPASAPGCLSRVILLFYAKGNSDPEVVSVLLSGVLVCESR